MNKKLIYPLYYIVLIFLIGLVVAVTLSSFDNYNIPLNITYTGNQNGTLNLTILKDANITMATMNLSGNKINSTIFGINATGNITTSGGGIYFDNPEYTNDTNFSNYAYCGGDGAGIGRSCELNNTINASLGNYITYYITTIGEGGSFEENSYWYFWNYSSNSFDQVLMRQIGTGTKNISILITDNNYINNGILKTRAYIVPYDAVYERTYKIFEVFNLNETYPNNPQLFTNQTNIWSWSGEFNITNQTNDFSSTLNTALNSGACDCFGCVLSGDNCTIPFIFHSDSAGILGVTDLNITWSESIAPNLTISQPVGSKNSLTILYSANASDNYALQTCKYWVMRGASVEVANTTITCNSSLTGDFTVSSQNTNYVFWAYVEDYSGNSNTTSSNFSTTIDATISGGGGSVPQTIKESEEDIVSCDIYREPLETAWNNFLTESTWDNFIILWNAFWNRSLCDSASSIVPIR